MSESLGLVEVVGYSTAVYIADSMVKTADVQIQKVERARGDGWMTVYVTGDVGAVNASVQAGEDAAQKVGNFVSSRVIARPAGDLAEFSYANTGAPVAPETETEEEAESDKTEKAETKDQTNSTKPATTRRTRSTRNTRTNNTNNKKK
ncbi:BMC domain-containing protein [Companilactobacillus ginsenosidimutans]|uniref:BMC domain-containing protein n=1 Tax=Companilactobacillus ginsenosidimutans TaxID=1007676 RepID=UPI0007DC310B|nr:BMC domain-containing protein [Companilactobacillus ginsenosidimutans]